MTMGSIVRIFLRIFSLFVFVILIGAFSGPALSSERLDTSSEKNLISTILDMRQSLSSSQRSKFDSILRSLNLTESKIEYAYQDGLNAQRYRQDNIEPLDGLTYQQLLQVSKRLDALRDKNRKAEENERRELVLDEACKRFEEHEKAQNLISLMDAKVKDVGFNNPEFDSEKISANFSVRVNNPTQYPAREIFYYIVDAEGRKIYQGHESALLEAQGLIPAQEQKTIEVSALLPAPITSNLRLIIESASFGDPFYNNQTDIVSEYLGSSSATEGVVISRQTDAEWFSSMSNKYPEVSEYLTLPVVISECGQNPD